MHFLPTSTTTVVIPTRQGKWKPAGYDGLLLEVGFARHRLSFSLKLNSSPEVMYFCDVSIRPPDKTGFSGCTSAYVDARVLTEQAD